VRLPTFSTLTEVFMARKIVYWVCTALASLALLGSLSYLTGSEEVVQGFAKAGYPQHLRIVLGIAKPIAAIVILLPGLALLKEWAYAGVTFALVMATISAYLSGDDHWVLAFALLVLVGISYFTRPATRRVWRTRSDDSARVAAVT
jgi:DoxX-like family